MRTVLARRAPIAKLGSALLLPIFILLSLDPIVPAVTLAVELLSVPLFGVRYRDLARRTAPLLFSAFAMLVTFTLFAGERTGTTLVAIGPIEITSGVLATASALALRLLAIALPGILVFASTDPTDLADSLIQHGKASPRFAIGALAAFRLVGLFREDWRMITMARRARGIDGGRNPVGRARLFVSTAFALLVGSIRHGVRLSRAMDARGFNSDQPRGIARPQTFGPADAALIAGTVALGVLALAATRL